MEAGSVSKIYVNTVDEVIKTLRNLNVYPSELYIEDGLWSYSTEEQLKAFRDNFEYFKSLDEDLPSWLESMYKAEMSEMQNLRYSSEMYDDEHMPLFLVLVMVSPSPKIDGRVVFVVCTGTSNGEFADKVFQNFQKLAKIQLAHENPRFFIALQSAVVNNDFSQISCGFQHILDGPGESLPETILLRDLSWKGALKTVYQMPVYTELLMARGRVLNCRSTSMFVPLQYPGCNGDPHYKPFSNSCVFPFEHMYLVMDGGRIQNAKRVVAGFLGDAYTNNNPFLPLCGRADFASTTKRFDTLQELKDIITDNYTKALESSLRTTRHGSVYGMSEVPKNKSKKLLKTIAQESKKTLLNPGAMANEVVVDIRLEDVVGVGLDESLFEFREEDLMKFWNMHKDDLKHGKIRDRKDVLVFLACLSHIAATASTSLGVMQLKQNPFSNVFILKNIKRNGEVVCRRLEPLPNARTRLKELWEYWMAPEKSRSVNPNSRKRQRTVTKAT